MTTRAPKVLLLDHDDDMRKITARMLRNQGAGVSPAATLEEAISLSQQRAYDVALIDVSPSMPGAREILDRLQRAGGAPPRVVVCTDAPLEGDARDEAGHDGEVLLVKPYPFDQMIALVFGRPYPRTAPAPRPSPVARVRSTRRAPGRAARQPAEATARVRPAPSLVLVDEVCPAPSWGGGAGGGGSSAQTARTRPARRRAKPDATAAVTRCASHRPLERSVRSPRRAARGRRHPG